MFVDRVQVDINLTTAHVIQAGGKQLVTRHAALVAKAYRMQAEGYAVTVAPLAPSAFGPDPFGLLEQERLDFETCLTFASPPELGEEFTPEDARFEGMRVVAW